MQPNALMYHKREYCKQKHCALIWINKSKYKSNTKLWAKPLQQYFPGRKCINSPNLPLLTKDFITTYIHCRTNGLKFYILVDCERSGKYILYILYNPLCIFIKTSKHYHVINHFVKYIIFQMQNCILEF